MSKGSPSFTVLWKNPDASARLVCFHHAGGNGSIFRSWAPYLGDRFELVAAQLPGRGRRFSEPLIEHPEELLARLGDDFIAWTDKPYILFGHSMGATLAYEIACTMQGMHVRTPLLLAVCGRRAPHVRPNEHLFHRLPEHEFVSKVRSLEGTPPDILENPELLELLVPVLRADFQVAETHRYTPKSPLSCPILAFKGTADRWVPEPDARAWSELTQGSFECLIYDGGHFLLDAHRALIAGEICRAFDDLTAAKRSRVAPTDPATAATT